ncbi:MAG: hypothetical protein WEE20_04480 [Bacteroidota bacterium]
MVEATFSFAPLSRPVDSHLHRDVLKVLLYFDLFRHPLSPLEIYEFLPSNSTTPSQVAGACVHFPLSAVLDSSDGLFFLKERGARCVTERRSKEAIARRRWMIARLMAALIRHFPFVRGVGVSGELSKGVSTEKSDIDYVLVTEEGRLWICRTLLILFKKVALLNSKKYFCVNHLVTERSLEVEPKNVYTAIELATVKPVCNHGLFQRYREANPWVRDFLPNWWNQFAGSMENGSPEKQSRRPLLQRILEFPFRGSLGDRLDRWLMRQWQDLWKRRYPGISEEARARLFASTPHLSTAYGGDILTVILGRYREQLRRYGLLDESLPSQRTPP